MKISPYRQVKVKSDMSSLFVIKWYKVCKINTTSMNVKKKASGMPEKFDYS